MGNIKPFQKLQSFKSQVPQIRQSRIILSLSTSIRPEGLLGLIKVMGWYSEGGVHCNILKLHDLKIKKQQLWHWPSEKGK